MSPQPLLSALLIVATFTVAFSNISSPRDSLIQDTSALLDTATEEGADSSADLGDGFIPPDPSQPVVEGALNPVDTLRRLINPARKPYIRPSYLYPGVSEQQDQQVRTMLDNIWSFNWDEVDRIEKRLQRLEKRDRLPPLSYLFMVSYRVWRVQNNEVPDQKTETALLKDIEKLSQRGLELSNPAQCPDSLRPTHLLIYSGIKGFVATLNMHERPIEAAVEGFAALRMLEQLRATYPGISDAYLGLGLFYCALAKAPPLVRGAVNLTGRSISLSAGLDFLRKGAYEGRYTSVAAKLYLIQFLSPYLGDQSEEKTRIFRSLQRQYPRNAFYVFLELNENLCFHPEKLTEFSASERLRKRMRDFRTTESSQRKYATLVKWQYLFINPFPAAGTELDTAADLREFAYYPLFLQALREKMLLSSQSSASDHRRRVAYIRKTTDQVLRKLNESMGPGKKGLFAWHVRDALRIGEVRNRR